MDDLVSCLTVTKQRLCPSPEQRDSDPRGARPDPPFPTAFADSFDPVSVLMFFLALAAFHLVARSFLFPPDNDQTYYLVIAGNLAEGRGLVEDFVWHYLRPVEAVTHPSNDYWLPLTSLLLVPSAWLSGSYEHATHMPVLWSALCMTLFYEIARRVLRDRLLAFACTGALLMHYTVGFYGATPDSTFLYLLLVLTAFLLYSRIVRVGSLPAGVG